MSVVFAARGYQIGKEPNLHPKFANTFWSMLNMPISVRAVLAFGMGLCFLGVQGRAGDLPTPKGQVILSVSGLISHTNAPMRADFDRPMLEKLGITSITTSHSWADKAQTFTGVEMAKVLDAVGVQGKKLRATAINNYAVDLDVVEMRQYPVLLAMTVDGVELRLRDRGPLWVVYPRDSYRELNNETHNFKWIWQLRSIDVQ